MERLRPIVIRLDEAAPPTGIPTAGMDRRQLFEDRDRWVGWLRTEPGMAGGWHHHGQRDTYIYVLRGAITIEYGPGGGGAVTGRAGDFIYNPAGMVHREITEPGDPAEAFLVRVGPGPEIVNVDGPDGA